MNKISLEAEIARLIKALDSVEFAPGDGAGVTKRVSGTDNTYEVRLRRKDIDRYWSTRVDAEMPESAVKYILVELLAQAIGAKS